MEKEQNNALDYYSFGHPLIRWRSNMSFQARKRMYQLFEDFLKPQEHQKVLDLGVTPDESQQESNFFEAFYPYKGRITAASIEDAGYLETKYPGLKFVQLTPGAALPFADKEFDILFCNAVIEHVGYREEQTFFLAECFRVAKQVFITTPNRWFPVEMHSILPFVHWLPHPAFRRILLLLKKDFFADQKNLNLFSKKSLKECLPPDGGIGCLC